MLSNSYTLITKLRDSIPRIYSATVVGQGELNNEIRVALDQSPEISVPAVCLLGIPPVGTRVKCMSYPPRGLLVFGVLGDTMTFEKLRLSPTGSGDVSATSVNHPIQIGPTDGGTSGTTPNLRVDNNEVGVYINGVAGSLVLQNDGGEISAFAGTDGVLDLHDSGLTSSVMRHKAIAQGTNQANYNATAGSLGSVDAGFTFIAPPSGMGTLEVGGFGQVNVVGTTGKFWGEIRSGGTIGAGALIHDGDTDDGPQIRHVATVTPHAFYLGSGAALVTGLTPGNTYNASGWFAVAAVGGVGAGVQMFSRQVSWIPSP